ncbi:MAG TPA: hypothetical protein VFV38_19635 [Ktedonobacteraceae bacterium]|nr:hypothetical protein [Ktedonobacteraceae bacterium]
MHQHYVEALVAEEEAVLHEAVRAQKLVRVERRGTLLVAEAPCVIYATSAYGSFRTSVPLLDRRQETSIVLALGCDNYDTDPPSLTFLANWEATQELPFPSWPKGAGVVQQHPETGKPFLCRPGLREFHTHFQHGDEPWDKYRGRVRPRDLLLSIAEGLRSKQVFR